MKIIRKTTKIIPLLAMGYLILLSFVPFGVCSSNVSETRVIPAGYYLAYPYAMEENDKLDVSFEVTLGGNLDINVWVVDSANFLRYEDGNSFYYKIGLERYINYDFQFKAEDSDTYYVIFSNTFSFITSKTVDIDITYTPAPVFNNILLIIMIFGIASIGIIISALIIGKAISNKPKKKVINKIKEEPIQDLKSDKRMYCSDCGAQLIEENSEYCPYCGKFQ